MNDSILKALYLILAISLFVFAASLSCGDDDDDSGEDPPVSDDDDDDNSDDDHSTDDDDASDFSFEIFEHGFDEAIADCATGDFYQYAYEYPSIPVDAKYAHLINFLTDPMLPPYMVPKATNGPLILYSDDLDVIVFSPMDSFFVSLIEFENGSIRYGIEGDVEEIPAGYSHRFIMAKGKGINATVKYWGSVLLEDRGREKVDRYADTGLAKLGYWTDNGAAYYYETAPGMNEEDTLLAVKDDLEAMDIPVGYMQIDSWWYYKEDGLLSPGGLIRWEPQTQMFPSGLTAFQQELGLPLIAHNRWLALQNDYLDDYDFYFDKEMAFPLGQELFDHFIADAKGWGVITYEQDWLASQYWGVTYLRNGVDHGRQWMEDMHSAVEKGGMTMQICMTSAPHLMSAIDLPSITSVRTSIDYRKSISKESYWPQFHTVNMLAGALGLWPFKDNFQSSEKYGLQEALISSLSGGMVGIADPIGDAVADIIKRTCLDDGTLLKPEKPATPIDAMFFPHTRPYLTLTYSDRQDQGRWHYLAGYHLASQHPDRSALDIGWAVFSYLGHPVTNQFHFPQQVDNWAVDLKSDLGIEGEVVAYNWRTKTASVVDGSMELAPFPDLYDFGYYILAPIQKNGLALIGDTEKFVTLADVRIGEITIDGQGKMEALVFGQSGEEVTLAAYDTNSAELKFVTVTIGQDGKAIAEFI